jgi:hypothetical protein
MKIKGPRVQGGKESSVKDFVNFLTPRTIEQAVREYIKHVLCHSELVSESRFYSILQQREILKQVQDDSSPTPSNPMPLLIL